MSNRFNSRPSISSKGYEQVRAKTPQGNAKKISIRITR